MLDELRQAAARQRANHHLRSLVFGCKRLLSERGEANSMAIARQLVERIDALAEDQLGDFFDYLSQQLSPDPTLVLQAAQTYAEQPNARHLMALTQAAEPPRQELLRRLNRTPGGTATLVVFLTDGVPYCPDVDAERARTLALAERACSTDVGSGLSCWLR